MGKTSKQKKKRKLAAEIAVQETTAAAATELDEDDFLLTANVLAQLAANPALYHSKQAKHIRLALHALISSGTMVNSQLPAAPVDNTRGGCDALSA